MTPKNTICLWYDGTALDAARFYADTFPDSAVGTVHRVPGDYPSGQEGDVLMVEFTVIGIPCPGLNDGPMFRHSEALSRSQPTIRPKPIACGTRSSAMVVRKAPAAGAGTHGACHGRPRRAR